MTDQSFFHEARRSRWLTQLLFAFAALMLAFGALAQSAAEADFDAVLDGARKRIDVIQKSLKGEPPDAELVRMRNQALEVQTAVEEVATQIEPQLASVDARLTELGKPAEGTSEAPDVAGQRTQLEKQRTALDAQIKLARLLSIEAEQSTAAISAVRRASFQARLGERTHAIVSGRFWSDLQRDFPRDLIRVNGVLGELAAAARATPLSVWLATLVGMIAALALRFWGGRRMMQWSATRVPAGRLRRSAHALAVLCFSTISTALLAQLIASALRANEVLSAETSALLGGMVGAVAFSGYLSGLGLALLSPDRPSWRVPALPDNLVQQVRWVPAQLATVMMLIWVAESFTAYANVTLITTVLVNCLVGLALCVILGCALIKVDRFRRRRIRLALDAGEPPPGTPLWLGFLTVAAAGVLIVSLLAMLSGYVAMGSFMTKQVAWTVVVLASTYLFAVLIDDIFMALRDLGRAKVTEDGDTPAESRTKARDQATVLLSGVARCALVLFALMLLLAQFGQGPGELLQRVDILQRGIAVGEINIRPSAMLQALIVLLIGIFIVRMLKKWLSDRFLPTTSLDSGMRVSATSLFGYAGFIVAFSVAMSAVGIGLERIAWVASALSVGIGFGLQAVVQNFVSGLILLAERPVKVGDWVALGGVEGDIRRINVRATEIQMGDRSTVIVPNSEFITKTVRNVTHTNPLGLVSFKFPMPLDTDPERVREIVLTAFRSHADVMESPGPNVQLDSLDARSMLFNATGFVSSPRQAYGVKSALLFDILKRLKEADLPLHVPQAMVISQAETPAPLLPVAPPTTAAAPEGR